MDKLRKLGVIDACLESSACRAEPGSAACELSAKDFRCALRNAAGSPAISSTAIDCLDQMSVSFASVVALDFNAVDVNSLAERRR